MKDQCFYCKKNINERQDPYCVLFRIENGGVSSLKMCGDCFDENADLNLKKRLEDKNDHFNWKICPYCLKGIKKVHFQIAKIHNTSLHNARICTKCYDTNIGIPRECFYDD